MPSPGAKRGVTKAPDPGPFFIARRQPTRERKEDMMKLMNTQERADYVEQRAVGLTASQRKHLFRRYEYIDAGDGVVIGWRKPTIQNTVFYDDEQPDPFGPDDERKKEAFIAYNMRYFDDFGISRWLECERDLAERGCCSGDHLSEPYLHVWPGECAVPTFFEHDDVRERLIANGMRPVLMSDEDREVLIAIVDGFREKFRKRLESHYRRYPDKIHSSGYWGDR